jgi:MFS family permease
MSGKTSTTALGENVISRSSKSEETSLSDPNLTQKVEAVTEKSLVTSPADKQSSPPHSTPTGVSLPPNGGLNAWLQVLGSFFLFFNTYGILTSYGVYQTYYESGDLFQSSSSDISWVGSIQAFLVQFCGIFSGPIYDRGYLGTLLTFGGICIVFGHMMLSLATEYWHVLLAQGICVGVGMGCLFVPSISILPSYFSTRVGLAVGVASTGSALGGVIYPLVLNRLIDTVGFAWSVRVIGFVALATMAIPISVMRLRYIPAKPRAIVDWTAFSDLPYMWFSIATMIGFMGVASFRTCYSAFYFSNS